MRRRVRTRRLSVTAMMSSLAFLVLVGAGLRSFWKWDGWEFGNGQLIALESGSVVYSQEKVPGSFRPGGHVLGDVKYALFPKGTLGFAFRDEAGQTRLGYMSIFVLRAPLWPLLLLLLIIPALWFVARPAGPAFLVIADAKDQ